MRFIFTIACAIFLAIGTQATSRTASLQAAVANNVNTAYSSLPGWDSADVTSPSNLLKFAGENMASTFDLYQDTLPDSRPKLIHARGSMAPVKFTLVGNNGHTGLFATGGDSCVARLSVAVDPLAKAFTPGMALKCYRDNQPSGNIIAMYSLDGQGDNWDFFANEFSNIFSEPTAFALKTLERLVFNRASDCATWLSLKQFSNIDQTGSVASSPSWPQQIFFVPAGVHFSTEKNHGDFRTDLASIPVGTKIWDVYVSNVHGGSRYKIAEVTTTGKFVASSYSDNTIFFQHDRGEEDNCGN